MIGGAAGGLIIFSAVPLFREVQSSLPDVEKLNNFQHRMPTLIYSSDGVLIGEIFEEKRYPVPLSQISLNLQEAFVAAEDSDFYQHAGLDYMGILRAGLHHVFGIGKKTGGSTITQQLAKTLLLTREQTITRKLKDMMLAQQIEGIFDKDRILELYLNTIFLGNGSHGVEAASQNYFRKSAAELSLAEASLIAGLAPAPSKYAPTANFKAAKTRQRYVLSRMMQLGMVSERDAIAAYAEDLDIHRSESPNTRYAPFFLMEVKKKLEEIFTWEDLVSGGYRVHTTIDTELQRHAVEISSTYLKQFEDQKGYKGPVARHGDIFEDSLVQMMARPIDLERESIRAIVVDLLPHLDVALIVSQLGLGAILAEDHKWALRTGQSKESNVLDFAHILNVGDEIRVKLLDRKTPRRVRDNARELVGLKKYLPFFLNGTSYEGVRFYGLTDTEQVEASTLLVDAKTGGVRVMIGGNDFSESQFNRATLAKRQVGSSIKPLYYSLALDHGFGAASQIDSPPIVIGDWKPENYSRKFLGRTTLRSSLINSYNIPSIQLFQALGMDLVAQHMRRVGLEWEHTDLSMALGSSSATLLEMVQAYSPFVNEGRIQQVRYIDRIEDRNGKVLFDSRAANLLPHPVVTAEVASSEHPEKASVKQDGRRGEFSDPAQVLSAETAYIAYEILEGVVNFGTGGRARIPNVRVAGKTGTTNGYTDAWFIGMTPSIIAGTWVGFDDARKSLGREGTGGRMAGPLWREIVRLALKKFSGSDLQRPAGVRYVRINPETGERTDGSGGIAIPVADGREPGSRSLRHALGMYGLGTDRDEESLKTLPDSQNATEKLRSFF